MTLRAFLCVGLLFCVTAVVAAPTPAVPEKKRVELGKTSSSRPKGPRDASS